MGLRVTILVALVLLTSCATATFLAEPGRKVLPPATCADKYCFGSAESIKDNSSVEIGGWLLTSKKGKKVLKLDIRITNKSEEEAVTPDDIINVQLQHNLWKLCQYIRHLHILSCLFASFSFCLRLCPRTSPCLYSESGKDKPRFEGIPSTSPETCFNTP